jgi:hypothetical protein
MIAWVYRYGLLVVVGAEGEADDACAGELDVDAPVSVRLMLENNLPNQCVTLCPA